MDIAISCSLSDAKKSLSGSGISQAVLGVSDSEHGKHNPDDQDDQAKGGKHKDHFQKVPEVVHGGHYSARELERNGELGSGNFSRLIEESST